MKLKEEKPRLSAARETHLLNLRAEVEERLPDPDLSPASIAAACGIGARYANFLLAKDDLSLGRLIQERRLDRCRKSFEDASMAHRTISDIAYGWGFSDMTHFSRAFKKAYGILPSEYRKLSQLERSGLILRR
jgi:AraC-like DNA-binding protein